MKKFMATVLITTTFAFAAMPALAQTPVIDTISPSSGLSLGGTLVTIRGSNLGATTSVTIGGGALANLVADNETTLRGNVPAGTTGAADVTATTPQGSDTLADGFTYKSGTPAARFALSFDGIDDLVEVPDDPALDIRRADSASTLRAVDPRRTRHPPHDIPHIVGHQQPTAERQRHAHRPAVRLAFVGCEETVEDVAW
jgi:hypothetical protein